MGDYLSDVAIIGAGLGGCALALALSANNINVSIFESRPSRSDILKSGVILTPNGLRVLDSLGIFDRIKDRCFKITHRVFKNDKDETVKKVLVANEELYGYRNHRIWRKLLLDEMKLMLNERGVQIHYDSKFQGIESDDARGVAFKINDQKRTASLLVGSDGIYSTVRDYLAPSIEPEYTGVLGVLAHIPHAGVKWPYEDYERNATIQGKPGAVFFLPEDSQGEDLMIGTQVQYPEQSREDLERLAKNYDQLAKFYTRDYDEHGSTAQSIIDQVLINKETLYIWPYLKMPTLQRWFSSTGRVIMVGDGAHALPPSSGQGVNQALEDVYSLTLLLTSLHKSSGELNGASEDSDIEMTTALDFWQSMRQKRLDAIFDWVNGYQNVERLPEADRKKVKVEGKEQIGDDMSWLYRSSLESDIKEWLDAQNRSSC